MATVIALKFDQTRWLQSDQQLHLSGCNIYLGIFEILAVAEGKIGSGQSLRYTIHYRNKWINSKINDQIKWINLKIQN